MAKFGFDAHFRAFSSSLQEVILGYGTLDKDLTARQKKQVEGLVASERKFKKILQKDTRGYKVYKAFISYILDEKRNILASRPFFRERQSEFSSGISPSIASRNYKRLHKFDINYVFISFALKVLKWGPFSKITKAAKEVMKIRKEIIEQNLPLAISRARIFRSKTPESHLSYMDEIQIASEGLCNAVDKFVLPYSAVFRSVCIGRATGDLIAEYSQTMLHFYPSDKRKIYRANKTQKNKNDLNFEDIAESVNSGTELDKPTNSSEIQHLMTAASHFSLDSPAPESMDMEGEENTLASIYAADDGVRPDVQVEQRQLHDKLHRAIEGLSLIEVKFLRLKGVIDY